MRRLTRAVRQLEEGEIRKAGGWGEFVDDPAWLERRIVRPSEELRHAFEYIGQLCGLSFRDTGGLLFRGVCRLQVVFTLAVLRMSLASVHLIATDYSTLAPWSSCMSVHLTRSPAECRSVTSISVCLLTTSPGSLCKADSSEHDESGTVSRTVADIESGRNCTIEGSGRFRTFWNNSDSRTDKPHPDSKKEIDIPE